MKIEKAKVEDFEICKKISDAFDESTPTKEIFFELVKNSEIFVAKNNDDIVVWFCSYKPIWSEDYFLQFLRVDKRYHKMWIWTGLITHIENIARSIWIYEIFSTATESNTASCNLHEKLWYRRAWFIDFDSWKEVVFIKEL